MDNSALLSIIADNPNLIEVLKKLLIDEFEITAPQSDLGVTDEVLGQIFRARLVGVNKIESAFKKIREHQTVKEEEVKVNMAR